MGSYLVCGSIFFFPLTSGGGGRPSGAGAKQKERKKGREKGYRRVGKAFKNSNMIPLSIISSPVWAERYHPDMQLSGVRNPEKP